MQGNEWWWRQKSKAIAPLRQVVAPHSLWPLRKAKAVAAAQQAKLTAKQTIRVARKPLWFEAFHWFVSTDGIVVVAGRDAQQNETLVKKYLRKQVGLLLLVLLPAGLDSDC